MLGAIAAFLPVQNCTAWACTKLAVQKQFAPQICPTVAVSKRAIHISHDMSGRASNRGTQPSSRKRGISRAAATAACVASVLLLLWVSSGRTAGRASQSSSAAAGSSTATFKRALRQWDRHGKDYLGMCLFIKDQHRDVREWVAHHLAIGASTIYVHDNLSDPPLSELLADHIATGAVQYIWWNHTFESGEYGKPPEYYNNPQMHSYEHCLQSFGPQHQFLGFLDSDEFLILRKATGTRSLPEFLRSMMAQQEIGGLAVHWRLFGSSGHLRRPNQPVLQAFTKCTSQTNYINRFVKVFANTDYAYQPNRHNFLYNSSKFAVNEEFVRVSGSMKRPSLMNKVVIHHYQIKSLEDFQQKQARGGGSGRGRSDEFFQKIDANCTRTCEDALSYGPYE